jgi:glyoxylase-like metal-dependent hydrolase (beta-lactamase superfamily II)
MVRRVYDDRVVFHAGDALLCPGVSLHHLPGHTLGLQAVRVDTDRGPVVLASDASHFWANLEREIPFPIVADVPAYLESLRALRKLAPSLDHIIPGHDPQVLARFPAEPGIADVVRLDLPPRPRAN